MLSEVDYSQGLPTPALESFDIETPLEATGYLVGGAISGAIVGYSISLREGWRQGTTVGLLVFFASAAIKMFIDIWKKPA